MVNPETPIDMHVTQQINLFGAGTEGPYEFGFKWQQQPGFFNSSDAPSSGFFNSGPGGTSGFGNFGTGMSGW